MIATQLLQLRGPLLLLLLVLALVSVLSVLLCLLLLPPAALQLRHLPLSVCQLSPQLVNQALVASLLLLRFPLQPLHLPLQVGHSGLLEHAVDALARSRSVRDRRQPMPVAVEVSGQRGEGGLRQGGHGDDGQGGGGGEALPGCLRFRLCLLCPALQRFVGRLRLPQPALQLLHEDDQLLARHVSSPHHRRRLLPAAAVARGRTRPCSCTGTGRGQGRRGDDGSDSQTASCVRAGRWGGREGGGGRGRGRGGRRGG